VHHPHSLLGKVAYVELEDVHTEPGIFIDSELGLTTTLLVGRCRVCGYVYMPVALAPSDCTPHQRSQRTNHHNASTEEITMCDAPDRTFVRRN
jgi:hypothetical protein